MLNSRGLCTTFGGESASKSIEMRADTHTHIHQYRARVTRDNHLWWLNWVDARRTSLLLTATVPLKRTRSVTHYLNVSNANAHQCEDSLSPTTRSAYFSGFAQKNLMLWTRQAFHPLLSNTVKHLSNRVVVIISTHFGCNRPWCSQHRRTYTERLCASLFVLIRKAPIYRYLKSR